MAQATLALNLLESLQIVTQTHIQILSNSVVVPSSLEVLSSVDEPDGDLVLERIRDDISKLLELLSGQFTGTLVSVDVCLLADEGGDSPSHSLDGSQGVDNLSFTVNVGVVNTENVLEGIFGNDE